MPSSFMQLCDDILAAASSHNSFDVSNKPLSALLNEMTTHVAASTRLESEDESIIFG